MITGSVPTENLPVKSHDVRKQERRILVRADVDPSSSSSTLTKPQVVSTIPSVEGLLTVLENEETIGRWKVDKSHENKVRIELFDESHSIPKYTVVVDSVVLEFSVFIYQWPIPEDHSIYKQTNHSVRHGNIKELLGLLETSSLCEGLPDIDEIKNVVIDPTTQYQLPGTIIRHSVPKNLPDEEAHFEVSVAFRSVDCHVVKETSKDQQKPCQPCSTALNATKRASRRKSKISAIPAKAKAPLSACGPKKLQATVQSTRLQCKQLEDRLQHLQAKIEQDGIGVSVSLETDLLKIMGGQNLEATPHMKFFWKQQMALLQSNKMGRRYHPQVIRFALSIHGKSPSAYRELRDSGALILPSERVLRDYKNYFKPKAGINKENIECLREKTKSFSDVQRYVALIMDEMKIQSNLVFDKFSGDLIGFIDLGDPMTNYAYLEKESVATHALAFLVRGLCTDMKHVIAYFLLEMSLRFKSCQFSGKLSLFWNCPLTFG